MENKFVTLTEEELTLVYGGKGGKSCVNNFLGGLAAGAAAATAIPAPKAEHPVDNAAAINPKP